MTRLILDSNQAGELFKELDSKLSHFELVITPLVLAELVLRNRVGWLNQLSKYKARFGIQSVDVMSTLVDSDKLKIVSFAPFESEEINEDRRQRLRSLKEIPRDLFAEARRIKQSNDDFNQWVLDQRAAAQTILEEGNNGKSLKRSDPADFLRKLTTPTGLSWLITPSITNGRARKSVVDEESLSEFVLKNHYLRKYFSAQVFLILSAIQLWHDQKLNVQNATDSWTDISNLLYAFDGDIILTEDKWLQRSTRIIESASAVDDPVRCLTVKEFLETQ